MLKDEKIFNNLITLKQNFWGNRSQTKFLPVPQNDQMGKLAIRDVT